MTEQPLTALQVAEKVLKAISGGATSIAAQTAGIITKEYVDLVVICRKLVRAESFDAQDKALEELDLYFVVKLEKEKEHG